MERLSHLEHSVLALLQNYLFPVPARGKPLRLMTAYHPIESLAALIDSKAPIANTVRQKILFGFADGLRYLSELRIRHGSLTLTNILLTAAREPMISDYGLSGFRTASQPPHANACIDANSIDVFSDGLILFSVLTDESITIDSLPSVPDTVPQPFRDLILWCWSANADQRPEFDSIVRRFLRRNLSLPVRDAEVSEIAEDNTRVLAPSFTTSSFLWALQHMRGCGLRMRVWMGACGLWSWRSRC
jgi:serine/threonine protein kinase